MTNKRETVIIGSVLLAIAIGYGYMTTQLPTRDLPNTLGIEAMPRIFSIFLGALSAILIVGAFVADRKKVKTPEKVRLTWKQLSGVLSVFAILAAYVFLIDIVGFVIVTPLVLFSLMYLEGVRKWVAMALVSVITTAFVFVLFRYVFEVRITGIAFL